MRSLLRFIGRRILFSQSKKFRLLSRIVTIIGVSRLLTRATSPARRISLARDESLEIRITKTGQHAS